MLRGSGTLRIMAAAIMVFAMVALQPGCLGGMDILYFDGTFHDYIGQALNRLHYRYDRYALPADFQDAITSKPWDLVIIENGPGYTLDQLGDEFLEELVDGGARLILSSHDLEDYPSLCSKLGFIYGGWQEYLFPGNYSPVPVFRIEGDEWADLWEEPNNLPGNSLPMNMAYDYYDPDHDIPNAFYGTATGTGRMVATYYGAANPPDDTAAIVMANSGRTILNAFYLDDASWWDNTKGIDVDIDIDADGVPDAVEWYMNEIYFVRKAGGISVQPGI